jgi:SpoVK/Ycf46/Vps4 family AAA+-type ATPase
MAESKAKRRTRVAVKTVAKKAMKNAATKQSAPVRRARTTRAKRPPVSVVVLSGSTPLRRSKAAELVAEELQLDLAKVNLSSVVSRYAGETEKNINRIFDEAERSGSILFFDGAEALFGPHRAGKGGASLYADAGAAHLLQRIEAHKGLVIVTTNGKSKIDQALSRQAQVSVMVGIKKKRRKKTA